MTAWPLILVLAGFFSLPAGQTPAPEPADPAAQNLRPIIEKHLGRPYVWGASGMKSFDCSGFVWRVMTDKGILIKRTTARKFYLCLPPVEEGNKVQFGNIIFFDNLKHCGIVNDSGTFYHAQCKRGTNLSRLNRFWTPKVCGVRKMP
ncbi:MAG: hypothetical protein EHM61_14555 [Acidobacteria bacterium]|nr:MAG: hypothetical protein EHM61_14555 [Acidobacteriota bacterium]